VKWVWEEDYLRRVWRGRGGCRGDDREFRRSRSLSWSAHIMLATFHFL
jgi:hypothetical protein